MVTQKDVFWKAGIITFIVFILGVSLGMFLESGRIKEIREEYQQIEVQWNDAKLQSNYFQILNKEFCPQAITGNLEFADRVYEEGLKLERYENANKLYEDQLLYEKRRYALLKVEFWFNSIYLKEKCNASYSNVVYFYKHTPSVIEKPEQDTQAAILTKFKEKYGNTIMLIPLPMDLNISTIKIMQDTYRITLSPTILINEEIKLEGLQDLAILESHVAV